jgi:sulfur-oxidizing protein SoxA
MKKISIALSGLIFLLTTATYAGPEEDRLQLIQHFQTQFPDIKFEDYIYGALIFDPDSKARYRSIMQSPPFTAELSKGEKLWKTPLKSGKTYADCLPNRGENIAGNYPQFSNDQNKVVTLEDVVNACRVAHGESAYAYADANTLGVLTAYLRTLSDGMKMNIKVNGEAARLAYENGKHIFYRRSGQLNQSCAHCHINNVGNRLRSELLSPVIGQATHWPIFRSGNQLISLQKQYEICHRNTRHVPDQPGSVRYNNLEYFHAYLSNGLPLQASVFRK